MPSTPIHETPSLAARHLVEGLIGLVRVEAQSASGPWGRYVGARDALLGYIAALEGVAQPSVFRHYQPDTATAPVPLLAPQGCYEAMDDLTGTPCS